MFYIKKKIDKIDVKCFWMVLVLWCDAFVLIVLSDEPKQNQGRGLVDQPPPPPPPPQVILLLAVLRRQFCFGSLVVLDVVCNYVLLTLLDVGIENK